MGRRKEGRTLLLLILSWDELRADFEGPVGPICMLISNRVPIASCDIQNQSLSSPVFKSESWNSCVVDGVTSQQQCVFA